MISPAIMAVPKLKTGIVSSGYMTVNINIGTDVNNKYTGTREPKLYIIAMRMRCEDLFIRGTMTPTIMLTPTVINDKITCVNTKGIILIAIDPRIIQQDDSIVALITRLYTGRICLHSRFNSNTFGRPISSKTNIGMIKNSNSSVCRSGVIDVSQTYASYRVEL